MTQRRLAQQALQVLYVPTRPALRLGQQGLAVLTRSTVSSRFTGFRIGVYGPIEETASILRLTELTDPFEGLNSPNLFGRAAVASNLWRVAGDGAFEINYDRLLGTRGSQHTASWISAGVSDAVWAVTFVTDDPNMGLAFRAASPQAQDYWVATTSGLHKVQEGLLDDPVVAWNLNPGSRLEVTAEGDLISIEVDGMPVGSVNDAFCIDGTYGGPWTAAILPQVWYLSDPVATTASAYHVRINGNTFATVSGTQGVDLYEVSDTGVTKTTPAITGLNMSSPSAVTTLYEGVISYTTVEGVTSHITVIDFNGPTPVARKINTGVTDAFTSVLVPIGNTHLIWVYNRFGVIRALPVEITETGLVPGTAYTLYGTPREFAGAVGLDDSWLVSSSESGVNGLIERLTPEGAVLASVPTEDGYHSQGVQTGPVSALFVRNPDAGNVFLVPYASDILGSPLDMGAVSFPITGGSTPHRLDVEGYYTRFFSHSFGMLQGWEYDPGSGSLSRMRIDVDLPEDQTESMWLSSDLALIRIAGGTPLLLRRLPEEEVVV